MPFVCQDRAGALARLGHEVHVLTTGHTTRNIAEKETDNLYIRYFDCSSAVYSKEFFDQSAEYCNKFKPALVHCDSLDVARPWWKDVPGITAVTLHGFAWGAFLTQWNLFRLGKRDSEPVLMAKDFLKERDAIASFRRVIAISRHEQWMLRDLFGISASLVYNPIPDYFFETAPKPLPEHRSFLCASITGHNERLFDLASSAAKKAGVGLVTVRDRRRIDMPSVYDSVSGLVVPTAYAQGYDLTVAEALARGRPVICSATGSYLREAESNPGLVTVPLGDEEELSNSMRSCLPIVPLGAADKHKPLYHAERFLEACGF